MNGKMTPLWNGSNGTSRGPVAYGAEAVLQRPGPSPATGPRLRIYREHPSPTRRPQRYVWRTRESATRPELAGAVAKVRSRFLPAVVASVVFHGGLLVMMSLKSFLVPASHPAQFAMATEPFVVHIAPWTSVGSGDGPAGTTGDPYAPARGLPPARPALVGMSGRIPRLPPPARNVIGVDEEISQQASRLRESANWVLPVGPVMAGAMIGDAADSLGATNGSVYGSIDGEGSGRGHGGLGAGGSGNGSGYGKPAYLRNPPPPYPRVARENGWEGTTVLQVEVLDNGTGGKIEVVKSSGYTVLDDTAVETVQHWRFLPAKSGVTPIRSLVEIPISFRMVNN
jgi:TonB family protein